MPSAKCCHRRDCSRPVVTAFREEALCLDHFCHCSYEFLDALGQRSPPGSLASLTAERVKIVDECARRVLDICMNTNVLNNLDRARLLDILLWCGDAAASLRPNSGEAILVSARSSD